MKKIVYESNSGFTAEYARILAQESGLKCEKRTEATLSADDDIIYLGWMCAGTPKGYKSVAKKCNVKALCIVGMSQNGDGQIADLKKRFDLAGKRVFYLQGGFDINRLHGIYKFMMKTMARSVGKKLEAKPDKTPDELDTLELMTKGGSRVSADNLSNIVAFAKNEF